MPYTDVMNKWKRGALKSGGDGKPVTDQKQAVAIMLSEKRKAEAGKTEYQPKTPANHPLRKLARPSSYADGGVVQSTGMAMVHKGETVTPADTAERNAADWNRPGGGYDKWKQGDAQREKDLPPGGMAKIRDEGFQAKRLLKPLQSKFKGD